MTRIGARGRAGVQGKDIKEGKVGKGHRDMGVRRTKSGMRNSVDRCEARQAPCSFVSWLFDPA